MPSNKAKLESQRLADLPRLETVTLAAMAVMVVFNFRADMHLSMLAMVIETAISLLIPIALLTWVLRHTDSRPLTDKRWIQFIQLAAIPYAFLPVIAQPITRTMGIGDPNEIIALCMVTNVCWYLAIFSAVPSFERTSFVLGAALTLFTCFMSQENIVFIFAFFHAVIALWWLFGNYWGKVSTKAIDGQTTMLPIRGVAILGSLAVLVAVGGIVWAVNPSYQTASLTGFMPTSGGDSWTEEFARSGLGDGDMLAAGENASTVGPVDSKQFIEDDKPSMYDISTEQFDGPKQIKKRKNRAQALNQTATHIHQLTQSEQSGRSFRTVRQPRKKKKKRKLEERRTDALLYIEGGVPARFAIDSFHHFDGWDWTKVDLREIGLSNPQILMERHSGKPWYVVKTLQRQFLESRQAHRVKIMRLDTNALPAPPMAKAWHIPKVDIKDMFLWTNEGTVRMSGELITSHTIIDIFSKVPNYYTLSHSENPMLKDHPHPIWGEFDKWLGVGTDSGISRGKYNPFDDDPESPYIQIPENETESRLHKLTVAWTKGYKPGWPQIEAIVTKLREEFKLDPELVASDDGRDSVASFLDQGGGPSYLFATVAAQMIRAAGYRTRLTRGFLIQDEDYDRVARQSYVTSENAHMWPEVCLDGWHWIPVEPTPGMPRPVNTMSAWQWVKSKVSDGMVWIYLNPITSLCVLVMSVLAFVYRRQIVASVCWLLWLIQVTFLPGRRLRATRRLIDAWFWSAGIPRPEFATVKSWCSQIEDPKGFSFFDFWQAQNFSSQGENLDKSKVLSACQQVVSKLSFGRIRDYATMKGTNQNESLAS